MGTIQRFKQAIKCDGNLKMIQDKRDRLLYVIRNLHEEHEARRISTKDFEILEDWVYEKFPCKVKSSKKRRRVR